MASWSDGGQIFPHISVAKACGSPCSLVGAFFVLFCFAWKQELWLLITALDESGHDLRDWMNNLSSWKRTQKNSGLSAGEKLLRDFFGFVSPIFTENCSRRKLPCMTHTFSFAGKLLHTRRSRSSAIKMLASDWAQKIIREKHSSESWMWLVKSSIPGALSTVLENFRRRFSRPNWPPLGLRGWILVCTTFVTRR